MTSPSGVVVGFDDSPEAEVALTWAAGYAGMLGLPLTVVLVGTNMDPIVGDFRARTDESVEDWRLTAGVRLHELDVAQSSVVVRHGPVVPELLEASRDAAMIVLGSSGHSLAAGTFTGSVSQHVARHAHCPVAVVRETRSPHVRRIIVGVDGSEESLKALRFACERAQLTGESVTVIHGYTSLGSRMVSATGSSRDPGEVGRTAAHELVKGVCAGVARDYPSVEVVPEAIPVRAAQALVDASGAATLVVVGSRGRDAFTELLLGSVSQHVLHRAECPVVIVR